MSQNTRQLILQYLSLHPLVTILDLCKSFGLTRADIQYHIQKLYRDGFVEKHTSYSNNYKGRPAFYFRLSPQHQPDNYPNLIFAILHSQLENTHTQQERSNALRRVAIRMFPAPPNLRRLSQNLTQVVHLLNHHNYQASWEAAAHGPRIILRNCPYKGLHQTIPELCQIDTFAIEYLTGISFAQNEVFHTPQGCEFLLI